MEQVPGHAVCGECLCPIALLVSLAHYPQCDDPNPRKHVVYEQPVWQTLQMYVFHHFNFAASLRLSYRFLGEMLCFLPVLFAYFRSKHQGFVQLPTEPEAPHKLSPQSLDGWKVLLLWIPALCDLIATTLMNVGLLYTPVSIYQMTRGALVLFVAFFSIIFLRRRLWFYQWVSLLIVILGVALVGLSGSMIKDAVKEATVSLLQGRVPATTAHEQPEATSVLVGK